MPVGDKDSAFYESPQYQAAEDQRKLPRILLGGDQGNATDALRALPLPWFPAFSAKEKLPGVEGGEAPYTKRLRMITVEPFYADAIDRVVSTVLAEPVKLGDDVPVQFRGSGEGAKDGYTENINGKGDNLDVFLRPVVKDAAGEGGYSIVLVDAPPVEEGETVDSLKNRAWRPYWSHYRACDKLDAIREYVEGRECLRELRLRDGKDDEGNERVRIIRAAPYDEGLRARIGFVTWRTVVKKKPADSGEMVEVPDKSGLMEPHQEIPAHVLYFNKTGFYEGAPGQSLLASLNMAHTEVTLDIRRDLALTSGATATMSGAKGEEKNQRVWDQDVLLSFDDPGASASWMERSGGSATVYMQFQERLEDKCRSYAKLPLVQRSGNLTATGQAIDASVAKTEVQVYAMAVKDFVERLLTLTTIYINRSAKDARGGSVTIKMPSILRERDVEGFKTLREMEADGQLTLKTLLRVAVAQSIGGLADDLDVDAEIRELASEKAEGRKIAAAIAAGGSARNGDSALPRPPRPNEGGTGAEQ